MRPPAGSSGAAPLPGSGPDSRRRWFRSCGLRCRLTNAGGSDPGGIAISKHHLAYQVVELNGRAPVQPLFCFRGIPKQDIDLRRTVEGRIDDDVVLIIKPGDGECPLHEVPDAMALTGCDDI